MNKIQRTEVIDTTNQATVLETCRAYIGNRHSGYEFRSIRYEAVLESLRMLGFGDNDSIVDVGGADGEFGRYLVEQGFAGSYAVVDGMLDGTDLNKWNPKAVYDFAVSIEVVEHLKNPQAFLKTLALSATRGVVVTTPNPHVVDVRAMDATHISPTYPADFYSTGYRVYPAMLFVENGDSLVGIRDKRNCLTN